MTTWYVSNEASNGYTVGHDIIGNGSAALPYLTIAKAISVAANTGDTIYVNGTTHSFNSLTINKAVNLQPTVAYGTTLTTTNATRCLNITHALGGTNTIGAFYVDGGTTPAQIVIQLTASVVKYTLVCQGTRITGVKQYGIGSLSGTLLADITMSNGCTITSSNAAFVNGVVLSNLSSGSFTVTGTIASPGLTITAIGVNIASSTMVMVYATSATGVTCNISGLVINSAMSSLNSGLISYGLLIKNIPAFNLSNSSITMSTAIAAHRIEGLQLTNTTATFNSIGAIVDNVTMALTSGNTGHAVLIGEETPDGILDNRTDNAIIRNCTITGSDAAATAGYHGLMLGNNRNGQMYNNTVSRVKIGLLTKEGTGHIVYNNTTSYIPVGGQHLRAKAATTNFYSNTCNASTGYAGTFISNTENDGATHFSASTFRWNKLLNPNNIAMEALNCPTGNTIHLFNNIYQGTGVLSFVYGATTYANLRAYKVARIEKFNLPSHTIWVRSGARRLLTNRISAVYTV